MWAMVGVPLGGGTPSGKSNTNPDSGTPDRKRELAALLLPCDNQHQQREDVLKRNKGITEGIKEQTRRMTMEEVVDGRGVYNTEMEK